MNMQQTLDVIDALDDRNLNDQANGDIDRLTWRARNELVKFARYLAYVERKTL